MDCGSCSLKEPLTRTQSYSKQVKCCDFTPFWSGFGVGAWLHGGKKLGPLIEKGDFELTVFGLIHSVKKRRIHRAPCDLLKDGLCSIWQQRPATCMSFFCASQYKDGLNAYAELEADLLKVEATLLGRWYFDQDGSDSLWQTWGQYMEKEAPLESLPKALRLPSIEEAEAHYIGMREWLKNQGLENFTSEQDQLRKPLARMESLC